MLQGFLLCPQNLLRLHILLLIIFRIVLLCKLSRCLLCPENACPLFLFILLIHVQYYCYLFTLTPCQLLQQCGTLLFNCVLSDIWAIVDLCLLEKGLLDRSLLKLNVLIKLLKDRFKIILPLVILHYLNMIATFRLLQFRKDLVQVSFGVLLRCLVKQLFVLR